MLKKVIISVCAVAAAFVIAALAFTAGFFMNRCAQKKEISSYRWAIETINKNYYFGGADASFTDVSLSAIAETCLDRYSEYYTAEEYKALVESNSGKKSGIGISYGFAEGRGIYVSSVTGNSPAEKSGLVAGEWLAGGKRGGEEVSFTCLDDFRAFASAAADGEEITLTAADGDAYTVAKSEFTASYAYLCTRSSAWVFDDAANGGFYLKEQTKKSMPYLDDGTAYMRLSQFYGGAADEFSALVEKFNSTGCASLILDLRTNGGGYVDVMCDIAGAFADGEKRVAMISRDKNGKTRSEYCKRVTDPARRISKDKKVYVLANSGTASASEALIGAMICYGALGYGNVFLSDYSSGYTDWLEANGQEVKTARSFGKGIMQTTFKNPDTGEALKLTTAKIFWPDGKTCIHDKGLTVSDGCRTLYAEWQHTKDDRELQAAVAEICG